MAEILYAKSHTKEDAVATSMFGRVELITPERAGALLASQINPRKPDMKRVMRYATERTQGNWVLHHQGIGINCEGRMIDGQHRMLMVAHTGLSTVFYVVYNVPESGTLHVDEQLPRSIKVAIKAAGRGDYSNSAIAVARIIETLPLHAMTTYARDEMISLLQRHSEAIQFAEENARKTGVQTASTRCLVARAFPHADPVRLKEWCEILGNGMPVSANAQDDSAAIRFRNLLLELRGSGGHAREIERYRKGQTALMSFLQRQPMTRIYGTENDLFPLV